jgi:hypothetical protein
LPKISSKPLDAEEIAKSKPFSKLAEAEQTMLLSFRKREPQKAPRNQQS